MKNFRTYLLCLPILLLTITLTGCGGGAAGNYNPSVDGTGVSKFMKSNGAEIGYLYNLFKRTNSFTDDQVDQLNKSRLTIESVMEYIVVLQLKGGVGYQDFKSQFGLATTEYYKMRLILDIEITKFDTVEPGIIYWNMVERADYFVSACNKIINAADDEIDARGMENLMEYGEGFYNALAPLVDMAM